MRPKIFMNCVKKLHLHSLVIFWLLQLCTSDNEFCSSSLSKMHYLYYWPFESHNQVGHISLELSDETYISWWPGQGQSIWSKLFYGKGIDPALSLEEDIRREGGKNPKRLYIPSKVLPRIDKIKIWWNKKIQIHLITI